MPCLNLPGHLRVSPHLSHVVGRALLSQPYITRKRILQVDIMCEYLKTQHTRHVTIHPHCPCSTPSSVICYPSSVIHHSPLTSHPTCNPLLGQIGLASHDGIREPVHQSLYVPRPDTPLDARVGRPSPSPQTSCTRARSRASAGQRANLLFFILFFLFLAVAVSRSFDRQPRISAYFKGPK
jgi:hypothetical protein